MIQISLMDDAIESLAPKNKTQQPKRFDINSSVDELDEKFMAFCSNRNKIRAISCFNYLCVHCLSGIIARRFSRVIKS